MSRREVADALDQALGTVMSRKRFTWSKVGSEVGWVVFLDKLPYGHRVGVDFGFALRPVSQVVTRIGDCGVVLDLALACGFDQAEVRKIFDPDEPCGEDYRLAKIRDLGNTLMTYIRERSTLEELRSAYRAGEFPAFILGDVRARLSE